MTGVDWCIGHPGLGNVRIEAVDGDGFVLVVSGRHSWAWGEVRLWR
jgi:hypothetical protein